MRKTALFLLFCPFLVAQNAAVQGIAVDAVSRQPMAGVHVSAFAIDNDNTLVDEAYGAISQADGRFSISGMKPATYMLRAQRNGFVYVSEKDIGSAVTLKPGEQRGNVTIAMTVHAVIAGRVTDEFGDPVRYVQVAATPLSSDSARAYSSFGSTDERGAFRIVCPPGKYYVQATPRQMNVYGAAQEIRSDGSQPAADGATWYPGSESKERASAIDVGAGREATADIRLVRQRNLTISGTVSGSPTPAVVYAIRTDNQRQMFNGMRNAQTGPDGKFVLSGVVPGSYRVWAMSFGMQGSPSLRSQASDVRVDNADETVSLKVLATEELVGTVAMDGTPPAGAAAEKRSILFSSLSQVETMFSGAQFGSGETDGDGNFKIAAAFPGKLRVKVDPLPEGAYIKSVKLDSVETTGDVVDLSRGVQGSWLKITIGLKGGRVEGAVLEEDGQPQKAAMVFVALSASPDDITFESLKRVTPGTKFAFTGVRPGKYRLMTVDPSLVNNFGAFPKEAFDKGLEIEVRESDRLTKDVSVKAKEKPGAQ